MNRLKLILYICVVAMVVALSSCRSQKEVVSPELTQGDLENATLKQRAELLADQNGEWTELNVPIKAEFKEPFSISGSGRMYMRRGKDIYISIKVLGLEVAVAYVDGEKICVADKINKRYMEEPISSVLGRADLTVSDIQDVLLGRVFINSKGTLSTKLLSDVKLSESGTKYTITPKKKAGGVAYNFTVNSDNVLSALNVEYGSKTVSCFYSNPAATTFGRFMETAHVATSVSGKKVDVTLKLSFNKVKFSVSESLKWKTPSGYERISAKSILNIK